MEVGGGGNVWCGRLSGFEPGFDGMELRKAD